MQYPGRLSPDQHEAFMTRYGPVFGLGILLCMVAAGMGIGLLQSSYLRHQPDSAIYALSTGVAMVLLLCAGQFAMIRGFRWAIWLILPSLIAPALTAASLFGSRHAGTSQVIILVISLVGLLVLNSERHRGMRRRLVEMRLQRIGQLPPTREDEFPDGTPPAKPWFSITMLVLAVLVLIGKVCLLVMN